MEGAPVVAVASARSLARSSNLHSSDHLHPMPANGTDDARDACLQLPPTAPADGPCCPALPTAHLTDTNVGGAIDCLDGWNAEVLGSSWPGTRSSARQVVACCADMGATVASQLQDCLSCVLPASIVESAQALHGQRSLVSCVGV